MFTVLKQLRSYNQIESRYLVHSITMNQYYVAVTSKKLNLYDKLNSISIEAKGSKKYLLKTYN